MVIVIFKIILMERTKVMIMVAMDKMMAMNFNYVSRNSGSGNVEQIVIIIDHDKGNGINGHDGNNGYD